MYTCMRAQAGSWAGRHVRAHARMCVSCVDAHLPSVEFVEGNDTTGLAELHIMTTDEGYP